MKIAVILGLLAPLQVLADESALARLAFWVEPAQMEAFAGTYAERIAPLLQRRGLVEATERGRATPDSIFTRLYAVAPGAIAERAEALQEDAEWRALLRSLGPSFATGDSLRYLFAPYRLPASPHRRREVGAGFRQGLWHSFGVQDGLPASSVGQIVQDRQGYLWIGMETGGLVRYDGHEFIVWDQRDGLPGNSIWDIEEDARGHLWFVTTGYTEVLEKALVRYDGDSFWIYNTADGLGDILPSRTESLTLNDRDNSMWVACFSRFVSGVGWDAVYYKYDGQTFARRPELDRGGVLLYEDRRGDLWFGTNPQGDLDTDFRLTRYDGERWHEVKGPDGRQLQGINSIREDRDGGMWFGLYRGALRIEGEGADATFAELTPADGLSRGPVMGIVEDREGKIWLRTYSAEGISLYDGRKIRKFTTEDGLINNQVRDIYEDRDGHVWFSTIEGISRYDGALFTTFTTEDGLANNGLMSLLEDREGRIVVGAFKGYVGRFDGSGFETLLGEKSVLTGANSVWSLVEDRSGQLWISGVGPKLSPVRYDGEAHAVLELPAEVDLLFSIALLEDREGRMWIGNRDLAHDASRSLSIEEAEIGGLMRYADGEQIAYTVDDGLPSDQVMELLQDQAGDLWIGTLGSGVSRFDGRAFENFAVADGLVHDAVWALMEDRAGGIWMGTFGGGVSRWDGETFTNYTSADGLAHDYVLSMVEDRQGHMWFATFGGGVSRWDGRVFQTLAKKDGLPNNAVHQIIEDRHGDMWIATEGGLVRYRSSRVAPRMQITNVIAERQHGAVDRLRVPSSQDFVIFEFRGRSFTTLPDDMVYVYRMEGYDADWRKMRGRRVEYRDLPRGDYTFEVKAVDRDLNYSEPARVAVAVHWPYAQLGWIGSLALALALIAWQGQRLVQRDRRMSRTNTALQAALDREEVLGRVRDRLIAVRDMGELPQEDYWCEEMRHLGLSVDGVSLQLPAQQEGHFVTFFMGVSQHSKDLALADYPWVAAAWREQRPVAVAHDELAAAGFDGWVLQSMLEVPLPGGGSLGINSLEPGAFDDEAVKTVQAFAALMAMALQRMRLDEQLQQLRYFERLRSALDGVRTPDEAMGRVGAVLMEALQMDALQMVHGIGLRLELDSRTWDSGEVVDAGDWRFERPLGPGGRRQGRLLAKRYDGGWDRWCYEWPLGWEDRQRGRLAIYCHLALSEAQELTLLVETGDYVARVLEAQELTAQLLQSARLVSLGEMAAGVAHELNQPLAAMSAILGSIDMWLEMGEEVERDELHGKMRDALGLIERMAGTIDHLRIFSRDSAGAAGTSFGLNEVVESGMKVIGTQLHNHGIAVELDLAQDLPPVYGHPVQIEQVLLNLLANARDAVDERAEREKDMIKRMRVRTWIRDGRVGVEVEDNGPGIAEADRARLFEPFYTTKEVDRGTGLGLSISYAIVRDHDGEIAFESRVGEGTVFRVALPVSERS